MPTSAVGILLLGARMFGSLKKLFGKDEGKPVSTPAVLPARINAAASGQMPFLRREAVFDRNHRLSGHLFYVQDSSPLADAEPSRQDELDQALIETLNASPDAWNTSRAYIPVNSASLGLSALDRLKTDNVVLLIQLAPDAEADQVGEAIEKLHERGIQVGLFRQPKHRAFGKVIQLVDYAAIDVAGNDANAARDFSAAVRAAGHAKGHQLLACNVETLDDHRFCQQWHYDQFHGKFASDPGSLASDNAGDPHKAQLLNLMRLVQGEAEIPDIAAAMKQDPLLSFRILRYLNSPALGLTHRIESLEQALIILGRQRLTRWLAVLLFSVRDPHFGDWLLIENALTRGRLMEVLGAQAMPGQSHDPLFLTGIFSQLDRLLRRPLAEILDDIPIADSIRQALLDQDGPYAPLLALAKASEDFDLQQMKTTAVAAGVDPQSVNRALLAATAWASEVTGYWE